MNIALYAIAICTCFMVLTCLISSIAVSRGVSKRKAATDNAPQTTTDGEAAATDCVAAAEDLNEAAEEAATKEVIAAETEDAAECDAPDGEELTDAESDADENSPAPNVAFSTDRLTLEQKYLSLPHEARAYYDEIVRYAMNIDGNKRFKNARYEEYKVGKNRLVRIKIKNGVIVCELLIPNLDFKNYVSDNKIDVRQSATVIKVVDEATLDAVKGSIDVAVEQIKKEKERKQELVKLRRRERRASLKRANAEAATTTEQEAAEEETATEQATDVQAETATMQEPTAEQNSVSDSVSGGEPDQISENDGKDEYIES